MNERLWVSIREPLSFTSTKDPVVNHLQPKSVTSSPSPYYLLRQCVNIDQHIANRSSGRWTFIWTWKFFSDLHLVHSIEWLCINHSGHVYSERWFSEGIRLNLFEDASPQTWLGNETHHLVIYTFPHLLLTTE